MTAGGLEGGLAGAGMLGAGMPEVPPVPEEVVPVAMDVATEQFLAQLAGAIIQSLGASLVTVSLWRPVTRDLVRLSSSRPDVYRVGGISSELGAEWIERCVVQQVSYVTDDESALDSDAFEHHDVLAALQLGSAINAVVTMDGEFLGCLNVLGPAGSFSDDPGALAEAERVAALLAGPLQALGRPRAH